MNSMTSNAQVRVRRLTDFSVTFHHWGETFKAGFIKPPRSSIQRRLH
jgi:hypothetical protein